MQEVVLLCEQDAAELSGSKEVYEDEHLLQYLESGRMQSGADRKERDRVQHRAKRFYLQLVC